MQRMRASVGIHRDLSEMVYDYIGIDGRVQRGLFYCALISLFSCAFTINIVSYAAIDPITKCFDVPSGQYIDCSESQACSDRSEGKPAKIYFDYNCWTQQYDMICDKADERNLAKSLFILFNMLSSVLNLLLTDIFGRKAGFLLAFINNTLSVGFGFFVNNYTWKLIAFGISNGSIVIYSSLFTMAFSELMPETAPLRVYVVAAMLVLFPLGSIVFGIVTFYTKDPTVLGIMTLVVMVTSSALPCLIAPESPMFLLGKGKLAQFVNSLQKIRDANRIPQDEEYLEVIKNAAIEYQTTREDEQRKNKELQKENGSPFVRIITTPVFLYQVVTCSLMGGLLNVIFYGISLNLDGLGADNITTNGIIYSGIGVISTLLVLPISKGMRRRFWMLLFQDGFIICGVMLAMIDVAWPTPTPNVKIAQTIISAVLIGGLDFAAFVPYYYFISELFPVEIRGTANSMIQFTSNLAGIIAPFIASASKDLGFHFLVGCTALSILVMPLTYYLKETAGESGPTDRKTLDKLKKTRLHDSEGKTSKQAKTKISDRDALPDLPPESA